MNLTALAKKAIKDHELPNDPKSQRAVRQKLQRILEEMPEAEQWYSKPGKKGDWDIPADAAERIIDSQEFWRYVAKRKGHEFRAFVESARREAEAATQAWYEAREERAAKTAADAQDGEADPLYPSSEAIKAEEIRLLLCGMIGLFASSEGKTFDYNEFKQAHSRLIDISVSNYYAREAEELDPRGITAQMNQERKLSDLRNFFV